MAELTRISALHGHADARRLGAGAGAPGVILGEIGGLRLRQIAAWPDCIDAVGAMAAAAAGVDAAPGPGRAVESMAADSAAPACALLRVEPLKWWLLGRPAGPLNIDAEQGAVVDLSHSRAHIRIRGPRAAEYLNRHLPLDLREASFTEGAVASSVLHHVGVTLWRSGRNYELFIPRGYALSVWEVLLQTAAQFDAEVIPPAAEGGGE
ncbi:MAG: sarcosine oxidase subunit gamma [Gammaproteobacteria bacterium]|nr:sarcosine oxidase subunit gamma [Gammaproteobacteria bacterium]